MPKPAAGTLLDPAHPLCPDHCWPILDAQDPPEHQGIGAAIAAPSPSVTAGSSSIVAGGAYGLAIRHGATSDHLYLTATAGDADLVVGFAGGFTMLLAYRKTDATERASTAIGITGGLNSAESMLLTLPYAGAGAVWRYGSAGANDVIVAGLTYGDDLWAVSTGPRGGEIWQNGILVGSNAAVPSRAAAADLFGWPAGTPNFSDLADTALVMTWNRQLAAADIVALSADPFQVFATGGGPPAPTPPPALFFL